MRLLILGATGRMGGHFVDEALRRGHAVTAYVRSPQKLTVTHPLLAVAVGDARDAAALAAAMPGHDAVLSALGARKANETYDLFEVAATNVIAAMGAAGVRRLVVIASAGILQRTPTELRRDSPAYPQAFKAASAAHWAAYQRLVASGLDWTVLCPPELEPGPARPYAAEPDYLPGDSRRVAMASVAAFAVDAIEQGTWVRQRVGLADRP